MSSPDSGDQTSHELLEAARQGRASAWDRLYGIYLPPLRQFCLGRLPRWTTGLIDIDIVIRETLRQSVQSTSASSDPYETPFHTDLRRRLKERINKEIRMAEQDFRGANAPPARDSKAASPLTELMGKDGLNRYETALSELDVSDRQLVIARLEFGLSYDKIAEARSTPSEEATRKAIIQALLRLAEKMYEGSRQAENSRHER